METTKEQFIDCPFTILVDSNESQPFSFEGIRADAKDKRKKLRIKKRWCSLGRWPVSFGDYSIEGMIGKVAIERKAMDDLWGTILGWETKSEREKGLPGRRQRFIDELKNLDAIESSAVIVEASFGTCIANVPSWGRKTKETNAKILFRSILSWQQEFKNVQWIFCDTRRMAEIVAFRWLERFFREKEA